MLEKSLDNHIRLLLHRYPVLESIQESIIHAYLMMALGFESKGKLLVAGNGGSAADAEHIVGELMKGFRLKRAIDDDFSAQLMEADLQKGKQLAEDLQGALPAIALTNHPGLQSAFLNDVDGQKGFAQQVYGYGEQQDVFMGISTSGNSKNIMYAAVVARAKGMKVIGLTGEHGGELAHFADIAVKVPCSETYMIQELHLPVYHCWCLMLEEHFFGHP